jgi:chitin-binding protein
MMLRHWRSTAAAAAFGLPFSVLMGPVGCAEAHGTMEEPASRSFQCRFNESPENPTSAACRAAIAAGGTQPFYDWNEVNIPNANGRSRELIPDGALCGAGRDKYQGLNLPRTDWPAMAMPDGGPFTFRYRTTAAHRALWELYVTKEGFDPSQPLRWDDLELFHMVVNPPIVADTYLIDAILPAGKQGRHIIYTIWQRQLPDSGEAFYSCSDVTFGN